MRKGEFNPGEKAIRSSVKQGVPTGAALWWSVPDKMHMLKFLPCNNQDMGVVFSLSSMQPKRVIPGARRQGIRELTGEIAGQSADQCYVCFDFGANVVDINKRIVFLSLFFLSWNPASRTCAYPAASSKGQMDHTRVLSHLFFFAQKPQMCFWTQIRVFLGFGETCGGGYRPPIASSRPIRPLK